MTRAGEPALDALIMNKTRRFLRGALGSAGAQAPCWGAGPSLAPHQLPEGSCTHCYSHPSTAQAPCSNTKTMAGWRVLSLAHMIRQRRCIVRVLWTGAMWQ